MDTSLAHENARLRALLQTQQDTIRQMAEYNRLLSQISSSHILLSDY
ncbi:hypothetical protein [Escherichia coli]|nr:hypothetical protein [Escherichia coli]